MDNIALVTGACGFVGNEYSRVLIEKGYRVIAVDSKRRSNIEDIDVEFF